MANEENIFTIGGCDYEKFAGAMGRFTVRFQTTCQMAYDTYRENGGELGYADWFSEYGARWENAVPLLMDTVFTPIGDAPKLSEAYDNDGFPGAIDEWAAAIAECQGFFLGIGRNSKSRPPSPGHSRKNATPRKPQRPRGKAQK